MSTKTPEILVHATVINVDKPVDTAPPINGRGQSLNVVEGILDANALWFDGPDLELRLGIDADWSDPKVGREENWAIED